MKKQDRGPAALVIDRSKWLRGNQEASRLRNALGNMCCLGFFGCSLGLSPSELEPYRTPSAHFRRSHRIGRVWPAWLFREDGYASDDGARLMGDNDDEQLSEQEREQRIAEVFAKHGVTVTFMEATAGSASAMPAADSEKEGA